MDDRPASQQIDDIIKKANDWRGTLLSQLRATILAADSGITEEVKWKKPSKPEGVAVWSSNGNVCIGEPLKSAVRLTFPKGAQLQDPHKIFNTRLDGNAVRAIDFHEGDTIDEASLRALVHEAVESNK
ncbi:MAG: DUF1801 domain-containing protein [Candidatus Saccharibacteria bacterium]